jgi:DNA end-binding protein Ku
MARKRKAASETAKETTLETTKPRASWKGSLTFGLVSFTVEAFNAVNRDRSDIHFNQLHAKCHSRIRYQKVCPIHGEVSNDEIVSGYEYEKGKYVEIEAEEIDALRTENERALKIDTFIAPEVVDPLYFDGRMYYLLPAGKGAEEPYAVLLAAMEREKRYGIGQVVFSGKEQIALVRPLEGILHMAMLNYEAEIRNPAHWVKDLAKPSGLTRQVKLAQTLIEEWTEDSFDFGKYEDHYRAKLRALIEAKVSGREVVIPESEEEPSEVVSLMDALKKSLVKGASGRGAPKTKPRTRRRTA